jgi:hypothetical protein
MKHEETRLFEGAESFEQPLTGIVFDRALMDAASPYKDEAMYEALRALAERHMLRTERASFALRVQLAAPMKLGMGRCRRWMGVHPTAPLTWMHVRIFRSP